MLWRTIHKITGLIGSLLITALALSGIFLNHRVFFDRFFQGSGVINRFIFYFHSGSMVHSYIIWLNDFGAICMLVLCGTGVYGTLRRKK